MHTSTINIVLLPSQDLTTTSDSPLKITAYQKKPLVNMCIGIYSSLVRGEREREREGKEGESNIDN